MARRFDLIAFDWDGTLFDSTAIITRSIQLAVGDVGGTVPSDHEASYVIGLGLMQALAHAAPDVPPEKYTELGNRYRFHYIQHQDDLSLFDGVDGRPLYLGRAKRIATANHVACRGSHMGWTCRVCDAMFYWPPADQGCSVLAGRGCGAVIVIRQRTFVAQF